VLASVGDRVKAGLALESDRMSAQVNVAARKEELISVAKMRPDLVVIAQAQSAQTAAIGAGKTEFGPRMSACRNWEEDRSSFSGSGGNNWVAGVAISVDILPAGKRAQFVRESAAKQRIDAQLALSQQYGRTEVSRAHIQRKTAQLSLETARAAMEQASESLRILKNRYNAGLSTITDLLRAEDAERQSRQVIGMQSTKALWLMPTCFIQQER
jgi:outer membrane protein